MSGELLAALSFGLVFATGFRWFRLVYAVAIPDNRIFFLLSMALGVGLGIAAFVRGTAWPGGVAAGVACFLGGMFLFTTAISAQKGGCGKLQVGAELPLFSAPDETGKTVNIENLVGQPLLLKFFRGHW